MVHLPKVLVVDNGALYCQAVRELLEPSEAQVFVAQDADSARVLLRFLQPDLLIIDVATPSLGGVSFLHELRQGRRCSAVPIIVAATCRLKADRDAALAAGANVFLSKPFSARDLREAIGSYLPHSDVMAFVAATA